MKMDREPPPAQRQWPARFQRNVVRFLYPYQDAQSFAGLNHHNCNGASLAHTVPPFSGAWISLMSGKLIGEVPGQKSFHFTLRSFGTRVSASVGFSSALISSC